MDLKKRKIDRGPYSASASTENTRVCKGIDFMSSTIKLAWSRFHPIGTDF